MAKEIKKTTAKKPVAKTTVAKKPAKTKKTLEEKQEN